MILWTNRSLTIHEQDARALLSLYRLPGGVGAGVARFAFRFGLAEFPFSVCGLWLLVFGTALFELALLAFKLPLAFAFAFAFAFARLEFALPLLFRLAFVLAFAFAFLFLLGLFSFAFAGAAESFALCLSLPVAELALS